MPVALVPFAQDVLESNGDLVVIANHTIPLKKTKRHGHVPAAAWEDLLLQLPDMLEDTTPHHEVHEKWGRQLIYIVKAGGRLWRIVIRKSAGGYLYISTTPRGRARQSATGNSSHGGAGTPSRPTWTVSL